MLRELLDVLAERKAVVESEDISSQGSKVLVLIVSIYLAFQPSKMCHLP